MKKGVKKILTILKIVWRHAKKYFKKELPLVDEIVEAAEEVTNEINKEERREKVVKKLKNYRDINKNILK